MSITIKSPEAAVAATPYLLGFVPQDSMVLLLSNDLGRTMALRVDLPPQPEFAWIGSILAGISETPAASVILMAYVDVVPASFGKQIARWLANLLEPVVDVVSVMVIGEGRIHSLHADPADDEQTTLDAQSLSDHPVVAQCVAAGMSRVAARADLAEQLQPVQDAMAQRVAKLLRHSEPVIHDYERHRNALEDDAVALLHSEDDLSCDDIVRLAEACADWYVRDPLIAVLLQAHASSQVPLHRVRTRLGYALTRLPDSHAGPVAATLALLAWADGDGATALMAADRATELDPSNTLAPLVAQALQYGLPPNTWASLTADVPIEVLRGQVRRSA